MIIVTRKSVLNELVVGQFYGHRDNFIDGLRELIAQVRFSFKVSYVSVALNEDHGLTPELSSLGFKPISKKIHFIYKGYSDRLQNLDSGRHWHLMRGDIDTW